MEEMTLLPNIEKIKDVLLLRNCFTVIDGYLQLKNFNRGKEIILSVMRLIAKMKVILHPSLNPPP